MSHKEDPRFNLIWESIRLKTFKNWKINDNKPCSAAKLAQAGFYYTGETEDSDAVQCFLCHKELDGWDENDDPWKEHSSHSLPCEFAKLGLPESALNQNQLHHFYSLLVLNVLKKHQEDLKREKSIIFIREVAKLKRRLKK